MATFVLEDLEGGVEALVFPETYKKVAGRLADDQVVLVKGKAEALDEGKARLLVVRGAAARAGQAGGGALRDHPRRRSRLGPGEGRAAARYPGRSPRASVR